MSEDDTKALRMAHVEAARMLGEAEDLHEQTETLVTVFPRSILARVAHACSRLALWIGKRIEADARAEARKTYNS